MDMEEVAHDLARLKAGATNAVVVGLGGDRVDHVARP
jgi:hypothetical protein